MSLKDKKKMIEDYPSQPGEREDQIKAAILQHLLEDRGVKATVNEAPRFVSALATLIREGLVVYDHDYACTLTKKGRDHAEAYTLSRSAAARKRPLTWR